MVDKKKIEDILKQGVEKIINEDSLRKKLLSGKKLRIKVGIDPTAKQIHLGQAFILWKLRDFQKLGHKIIFIIGDFTAQIGDPSGKISKRKVLSKKKIKENFKTYKRQISKILDLKKTDIIYNSSYLSKLTLSKFYSLLSYFSVAQLLEREMFKQRIQNNQPIFLSEFLYPILQAYDSYKIKSDLEIGGSDQLFNMILGRKLQTFFKKEPQEVMALKLLIGLDGREKMSQSLNNYIGIQESPDDQFGKIMSISDDLIWHYFEMAACLSNDKIKEIKKQNFKPIILKEKLAYEIVKKYWGENKARIAEKKFDNLFRNKKIKEEKLKEIKIKTPSLNLKKFLVENNLVSSGSQAQRLIENGAVKINGEVIKNWRQPIEIKKTTILKVGKHSFYKIINELTS